MRYKCPFCGYIIPAEERFMGQMVFCPSCDKRVTMPKTLFEEGIVFGDFVISSKVGAGSIGTVYKASQLSLERIVALKILSPEYTDVQGVTDFLKEARAAARLSHNNLVKCFAVGEEQGLCYMAMNYLVGETVKNRIKREGDIAVDESLHIIQQIAEALYYAWDEAKLIHRDVKPENIMITQDGIVKLTDLGLAISHGEWTEDTEISGSPSYMSPEQFAGEKLDTRSDIYSLGVSLYEMLTGSLPFQGSTLRTVAKQHFYENPVPIKKFDPKIPSDVAVMVKKMMAKNPDDRYANMEDLLQQIWKIRQKTAPDKELVPEIHTISVKRLDYNLQTKVKEVRQHTRKYIGEEMKRRMKVYQVLFVLLIMVVALLLTVWFLYRYHNRAKMQELRQEVEAYCIQTAESGKSPVNGFQTQGNKLLERLGRVSSLEARFLETQVRLAITEYASRKLESDLNNAKSEKQRTANNFSRLKKQYQNLSENFKKNREQVRHKTGQLRNISKTTSKIKNENRILKKKIKNFEAELRKARFMEIVKRAVTMVDSARYQEACAMIMLEAGKKQNSAIKTKLSKAAGEFKKLAMMDQVLTESGTQLAGAEVPALGSILEIHKGQIIYRDTVTRQIEKKTWSDLTVSQLLILARKAFPGNPDSNLETAVLICSKGILSAGAGIKENSFWMTVFNVSLNQALDNIRYQSMTDRSAAVNSAKTLLGKIKASPRFNEIKKQLELILK